MSYFAADVLTAVYTKISSEINTMLATIRTERSDTTLPDVLNVTYGLPTGQLPEIVITMETTDQPDELLQDNITIDPQVYNLQIMLTSQGIDALFQLHMCYYLEALQRLLHGCQISGITWVRCKDSIIDNITAENEIYKFVGIKLEVRIN